MVPNGKGYDRQWLADIVSGYISNLLDGDLASVSLDSWTNEELYAYALSCNPDLVERHHAPVTPTSSFVSNSGPQSKEHLAPAGQEESPNDEVEKAIDMVNSHHGEYYIIDKDGCIINRAISIANDPEHFICEMGDGKAVIYNRDELIRKMKSWEIRSIL